MQHSHRLWGSACALGLVTTIAVLSSVVAAKDTGHSANPDAVTVLNRYEARLEQYHTPSVLSFTYSVDQAGTRGFSQTHRIYRSGSLVRDETIGIGNQHLKPKIRIYRDRPNHYMVEALAPRRGVYRFTFIGLRHNGNRTSYAFSTTPLLNTTSFVIDEVELDSQQALPSLVLFHAKGAEVEGRGHLRFGIVENAWVVLEADAGGRRGQTDLREHINFGDYHFPSSLPPATFGNAD